MPNTVAAAMTATPWSVACVTMWKIGPECAAQHAKWVSAMAQNCGAASTSRVVYSRRLAPGAGAGRSSLAGSRSSRATGTMTSHARSPSTSIATRQSHALVSARASGAISRMPKPMPAETSATARPRRAVNHLVVVDVSGA